MTPQEIEQKTIEYMTTKMPIESSIVDRHTTYHSTSATHQSYASQLMNASRGSGAYRTYLIRCYNWLVLLKKRDIQLHNIIKD
jgi:hypothetical protein